MVRNYSKSGHAYVLYGSVADSVLVWLYEHRSRVSCAIFGFDVTDRIARETCKCVLCISTKETIKKKLTKIFRIVHLLASGVFLSGFVKDLLCLPRPLSPPLHRITMSGSAALEYGFPSTHSTNAVSVVLYALFHLKSEQSTIEPTKNMIFQIILYTYATSIVFGRLYCGMHGFVDVIVGSWIGAVLAYVQCHYGDAFDQFVVNCSAKELSLVILLILVLVRIHPEPADSCPCFDDSVAFTGVMIGAQIASWHFSKTTFSLSDPVPGTVPFDLQRIGWIKAIARVIMGVAIVFAWREIMKPSLLRLLPPIFRVIEKLGLSLPRRFFTRASYVTIGS